MHTTHHCSPDKPPEQTQVLQRLTRDIQQLETSHRRHQEPQALSTGCQPLDECLPQKGYLPGSVVEYLRLTPACGATQLALAAASEALQDQQRFLVVIDTQHRIYPPALASRGIDLKQVILVRPESRADALWAADQALRTSAVAAVVAEFDRIDDRAARRLQLAAEIGGGIALLLRSATARHQPSWAEVQWLVRSASSSNRRLQVQLARVRGGKAGAIVGLQIDSGTGKISAIEKRRGVSPLPANILPATPARRARPLAG